MTLAMLQKKYEKRLAKRQKNTSHKKPINLDKVDRDARSVFTTVYIKPEARHLTKDKFIKRGLKCSANTSGLK